MCGEYIGTYRFKSEFCGFTDTPKNLQKAMDNALQRLSVVLCFLVDLLIVSKGSVEESNQIVESVLKRLFTESFAPKLSKSDLLLNKLSTLTQMGIAQNGQKLRQS